jgi:ribosomal protein S18 acetylase RimI-like enzyme
MIDYKIRPLTPEDEPILWEMLYYALYSAQREAPPREIVQQPQFARYVDAWGRAGDRGFLAHEAGGPQVLGAAWLRLPTSEDQGSASAHDATPELAFAVHPQHRQRGIGTALLTQLVRSAPDEAGISISLAAGKPVLRLYERFGFKVIHESAHAIKMRR